MQANLPQIVKKPDVLYLQGSALAIVFMLPTIYCALMLVHSAAVANTPGRPMAQFALAWSLSGLAAWMAASTAARNHCWRIASVAISMGIAALVAIGAGS